MENLKWLYVEISFDPKERRIVVMDLVDTNNEPAMMTRSVRGVDKCWAEIKASFSASWTWANALAPIEAAGLKTHHWCRMD